MDRMVRTDGGAPRPTDPSNRMIETDRAGGGLCLCECGKRLPAWAVDRHIEQTGHKLRG